VTFSLLSRYLVCPERFRIHAVEGLAPAPEFNHRIEYGSLWHACEEGLAKQPDPTNKGMNLWEKSLDSYRDALLKKYPMAREQVAHWWNVCRQQFPRYVTYWRHHPDVKRRKNLFAERAFAVPYALPSGRVVILRGKWDSVDLIDGAVYLQENKTKGDVREGQLQRQLTFDLQTMLYVVALFSGGELGTASLGGVRYNVVRRPLSGGKGSIVRHKGTKNKPEESHAEFYARLGDRIGEEPEYFFMRWRVEVSWGDVKRFREQCLDPILENLCDDYEWWSYCAEYRLDPFDGNERNRVFNSGEPGSGHFPRHYRRPFGVYNVLDEGGSSDLDEYLMTGSKVGLVKLDTLFPELES